MESKPLEYEPAHRKLKGLKWIVVVFMMIGCFAAGALLFGWMSARQQTPVVSGVIVSTPVSLPEDPMKITLRQRTGIRLPGRGLHTPLMAIGDITDRQVLVQIQQSNDQAFFSQSMKEGDVAAIAMDGQTLHLKLAKLDNVLVGGNDQATFLLSTTKPVSESAKIDALIAHIENLEGATFYRNGDWHAARDAAAHLRRKRDYVGDKLKTADQFIDELASKSSTSDEAYRIKLKDGTETPAGDYLRGKLPEIEKSLRSAP